MFNTPPTPGNIVALVVILLIFGYLIYARLYDKWPFGPKSPRE